MADFVEVAQLVQVLPGTGTTAGRALTAHEGRI